MKIEQKRVKGVLVGCGFMGGMHAQVYKVLPDVELVAAVDPMKEAATEKLERLGYRIPVYATLAEAIQNESVDFVDICLPTDLHHRYAMEVLEAGKALFCEKPLALNLEDADAIVAAAKEKGISAQVGHCIRFWPEYQALTAYHQSGKGGQLLGLNLARRSGRPGYGVGDWLNDPKRSGGAALDLHIHDTDFVLALLGEPETIESRVTEDHSGPVHIFSLMDYRGTTVSLEGGWGYPKHWGFQMTFQAIYEGAVLDFDSSNGKGLMICENDASPVEMRVEKPDTGASRSGEGNISELGGYYNQLEYFTGCLRDGKAPTIATLQDARNSLALALKEIAQGRQVKKPY